MAPRRVLYVTDGDCFGGVEAHLLQILAHLDRNRFTPSLQCPPVDALVDAARSLEVPVQIAVPVTSKRSVRAWLSVARDVWGVNPHVFHAILSHSYAASYSLAAAIACGTPAVVISEGNPSPPANALQGRLRRPLLRRIDAQLAPSEYAAGCLRRLGQATPRLQVLRNAVHAPDPLPRSESRAALGVGHDRPLVGAALRLEASKRVDLLIETGRLLPHVEIIIMGEGGERDSLERAAQGTNVRFSGFRSDAHRLLRAFDVFVHPSPAEPQGIAVLEAMAAGTPVVGVDSGGIAESVEHERTGLLVMACPGALAAAVNRLLLDPVLARRLGDTAARHTAEHFSAAAMTEQLEGIYDGVLAERLGPDGGPSRGVVRVGGGGLEQPSPSTATLTFGEDAAG